MTIRLLILNCNSIPSIGAILFIILAVVLAAVFPPVAPSLLACKLLSIGSSNRTKHIYFGSLIGKTDKNEETNFLLSYPPFL